MKLLIIPIFFILEFYTTSKLIDFIGFGWSMAWFFVAFLLGVFALKNAHLFLTANISQLFANPSSIKKVYSGSILYVVGAVLLIIPGVLSDGIGILLISYTLYSQTFGTITNKKTEQKKDSDVIDAEIIDSNSISSHSNSKHSV